MIQQPAGPEAPAPEFARRRRRCRIKACRLEACRLEACRRLAGRKVREAPPSWTTQDLKPPFWRGRLLENKVRHLRGAGGL